FQAEDGIRDVHVTGVQTCALPIFYGFFAALTVAPFIRDLAESIGLEASSQSALAAGLVMGIMIIPFVSSLSDDVINAVPQTLRRSEERRVGKEAKWRISRSSENKR